MYFLVEGCSVVGCATVEAGWDLESVRAPLLHWYVQNIAKDATEDNLRKLLTRNNVEGVADVSTVHFLWLLLMFLQFRISFCIQVHIIKDKRKNPYAAVVAFGDANSASDAFKLVDDKGRLNGLFSVNAELLKIFFCHHLFCAQEKRLSHSVQFGWPSSSP